MKKLNILRLFAALVACSAMLISCQPEGPDDGGKGSAFPEYKEYVVAPGETVTISFDAVADWTVMVPDNTMQWFWIADGDFVLYRLSGKAGSNTVTICVSDTEELDTDRVCEVTMKMGGKTQEIAKITRPAKEKVLKVNAAQVIDGEVQFTEDGSSYLYVEEEPSSMELVWGGTDFRLPVRVEANFNWTYVGPEWLSIDVPANGVGTSEVVLYGVPSRYPLADASDVIKFMYGDLVIGEYTVMIPGCEDIFSYNVNMSLSSLEFNFSGKIKVATGYIDGPVSGTISGTSGVHIETLTLTSDGYTAEQPAWLDVNISDYDTTDGAPVLQEREFTISAGVNEGEDRHAAIFFLPPAVQAEASELFDGAQVKEEYSQYMLPVTQLSSDQEFISMVSNPADVAAAGATFVVSEDEQLHSMFGQTKYAYELTYNNEYARDGARMMFTSAVTSYKVFDEKGAEVVETEDDSDPDKEAYFLTVTLDENKLGGVVSMVADVHSTGYVVMYGATDNVLAVVRCVMDPEQEVGAVANVAFVGESAKLAAQVGATLEEITEGPLYDKYKSEGVPVWSLTYTQELLPMTVSLPMEAKSYCPNPFMSIDFIRVNGIGFYDITPIGSFERMEESGVAIYMNLPEGETYKRVAMYLYSVANGGQGTNETLVMILVCTMDLTGTVE